MDKQQGGRSIGSHHADATTLPPQCLTHDIVLWIISCSIPSPDFSLPISRIQVYLGFFCQNYLTSGFWRLFFFLDFFLAKSNLVFLFLNVTSCLHLVLNLLGFTFMMAPLDFDFDMKQVSSEYS